MRIAFLFILSALAGCGQEPVGDTKKVSKVSIMGSRTVSKMVEKGTRVFGKTLERAKTVFMPEIPQLELAIPEGSQRELPNPVSDEKTWLSKDWLSANVSIDAPEDLYIDPDQIREMKRRSKLSKKEQRRLAKEDERRRRKYREENGEYTGKHGQPQPPW